MLIKNGSVVTETEITKADVLILDGKIEKVGADLEDPEDDVIDVPGMYVMPGAIDAHTRFCAEENGLRSPDDFFTGTVAAACGGVTCVINHMEFGPRGCGLRYQADEYRKLAEPAVIDYSFHGIIQRVNDDVLDEMEALTEEGITSFKFCMTTEYKIDDFGILELMHNARGLGAMLCVHAENDGIIKFLRMYARARGFLSPIYHARSRPPECEAEAVDRLMFLSAVTGCPLLYITHLSTAQALAAINDARGSGLKNIFVETCPQYMLLDETFYRRSDGVKYIACPPLRKRNHCDAMWEGAEHGDIQVIASAHCAFNYEAGKRAGAEDFMMCPSGLPGVETRVPLIFSEGVMKRRITPQRFVELCCANPAKLFGLYPAKGCIAPGSDADLMIINPAKQFKIQKSTLHENVDYTVYDGMELRGDIEYTISRGEVAVHCHNWIGSRGWGRFIKRGTPVSGR
ncbi:MAG: dihydropyrimidinase [Clostridiales bacterium]|jgi:dihydropyrimidinase|nr:dihydropyrimidinase [Clostridiales bacterium]